MQIEQFYDHYTFTRDPLKVTSVNFEEQEDIQRMIFSHQFADTTCDFTITMGRNAFSGIGNAFHIAAAMISYGMSSGRNVRFSSPWEFTDKNDCNAQTPKCYFQSFLCSIGFILYI